MQGIPGSITRAEGNVQSIHIWQKDSVAVGKSFSHGRIISKGFLLILACRTAFICVSLLLSDNSLSADNGTHYQMSRGPPATGECRPNDTIMVIQK